MARFLVTGGAGFIGSHLVAELLRRGETVGVLDNLSTGQRRNLDFCEGQVEWYEGDVNDPELLVRALAGVEVVFHQAALPSVPVSIENPLATHTACASGTLQLLDQARRSGVRRLVYAASSSLYGEQPHMSNRETDVPAPQSPYAVAKLAAEYYCHAFYHCFGLETVCLRYFNVFGPRQDPQSPYSAVIPLFITALLDGRAPTVFGDGLQSRDFTYVGNVVHGNLLAAEATGAAGKSFNLAEGGRITLLDLVAALNRHLGTDLQPVHAAPRTGDIRDSSADITLAREVLHYEPQVSFEEGLRRSIDYYRQQVEST
ncbi:MAG TPA: LPS biosynthesis protein WbpP [Planctomycetaceae bacterium]|nr:LPS biosynthesis protein WbpP [Planctomycetaceae bacterium]|tara:strand:- start:29988 stop:30932 length:945 start_codon:yes stop_codon:yes gene_type:complete